MTDTSETLTVRHAQPEDIADLGLWTSAEPVAWIDGERFAAELATRNYRLEWSWIAERDGRPVGRALWWGRAADDRPATLDCLLATPASAGPARPDAAAHTDTPERIGAALIRAGLDSFGAGRPLEFNVDVASTWADEPAAVAAVRWRHEAARAGGFTRTTERISFARSDAEPLPERSTRLRFVEASDGHFRALFARVAKDSLDAHTVETVAAKGVEALADDDLEFYLSLPGERAAWRVAELPDGTTVGFIIPTRNAYDASISYLGVLPEHRGNGYVHDLLAEMVHVHHADGQARIVGTTDAGNAPMQRAFERAGFAVTRVRIVHAE